MEGKMPRRAVVCTDGAPGRGVYTEGRGPARVATGASQPTRCASVGTLVPSTTPTCTTEGVDGTRRLERSRRRFDPGAPVRPSGGRRTRRRDAVRGPRRLLGFAGRVAPRP